MAEEELLGYHFHQPEGVGGLGHLRLDVNLFEQPTERHFDPETATFPVIRRDNQTDTVEVIHPWHAANSYRVIFGRIYLRDRKHKTVEAFSFGGDLAISASEDLTSCRLSSPVSILDLSGESGQAIGLVEEIEAAVATVEAEWSPAEDQLWVKIANLSPQILFRSSLTEVARRISAYPPAARGSEYWEEIGAIREAIEQGAGRHSTGAVMPLSELLAR